MLGFTATMQEVYQSWGTFCIPPCACISLTSQSCILTILTFNFILYFFILIFYIFFLFDLLFICLPEEPLFFIHKVFQILCDPGFVTEKTADFVGVMFSTQKLLWYIMQRLSPSVFLSMWCTKHMAQALYSRQFSSASFVLFLTI